MVCVVCERERVCVVGVVWWSERELCVCGVV